MPASKKPSTNGRVSFGKIKSVLEYPDFLSVQLRSFRDFMQDDILPEEREPVGLQTVFLEHFPIQDSRERYTLEFLQYALDAPKHSVDECIAQGLSYSVPLKARLRLSSKEDEDEDEPEEAIEQDVYLGNLPYMTNRGSFVINGAERVIVSQLHRSPGVFFGQSVHPNGTMLYSARVIPYRGSWIEFSTDVSDMMWAYIDRKKKLPVTTLLRAIGFSSDEEILNLFNLADKYQVKTARSFKRVIDRQLASNVSVERITEIVDEDTGEILEEKVDREIVFTAGHTLVEADYDTLKEVGVEKIFLARREEDDGDDSDKTFLLTTLRKDPTHSEAEALEYLYLQLRGGESPDQETARGVLDRLFFSEKRYDLGEVGRYRLNNRLSLKEAPNTLTLTREDIIAIIAELVNLKKGRNRQITD